MKCIKSQPLYIGQIWANIVNMALKICTINRFNDFFHTSFIIPIT